ncbi:VOC family protein [Streptomyces sp. NPDC091280]|uniref:VOC family protein n=1 Tax=Streptomyces sp. NPDC091280 TaxID=3365984 RepID=UPI00380F88CE
MTTAPADLRWSHIGLNCRDQRATEDFYTRHFGFVRARVVEADGVRVVFLRNGPVCLELFATDADALFSTAQDGPANPGTARHLAFQVDDVGAFLAAAGDELEPLLGPLAFDEVIPGWRTVWVSDPDGIVLEISQGYTDQTTDELATYA